MSSGVRRLGVCDGVDMVTDIVGAVEHVIERRQGL
jgi:hypothetical protein